MNTDPSSQTSTNPPLAVVWFKVYAGAMTLMYVGCFIGGLAMIFLADELPERERAELYINGIILAVMGLPLAIASGLPLFLPRKGWAWTYNIVIIAIGLTSCCCIPACVPLLIFWLKPETKEWYGKGPKND